MQDPPKGFVDHPYPYHHELELVIENEINLGYGIATPRWLGHTNSLHSAGGKNQGAYFPKPQKLLGCRLHGGS